MKTYTDNAARARTLLRRANAPLSPACEGMIAADLTRVLSAYFELEGEVRLRVTRGGSIRIAVEAEAKAVKPFGTVGEQWPRPLLLSAQKFLHLVRIFGQDTQYLVLFRNCCKCVSIFCRK